MDWKKAVFFIGALIVIGAPINWAGAQGIARSLQDPDIECFFPTSGEETLKKKMEEKEESEP